MIKNLNKKNRKDDIILLSILIFAFLFALWLCTPPGNKFAQICFYGNHMQYFVAKVTKSNDDLNEWKFYYNNAVYLAQMEMYKDAVKEINKCIQKAPGYLSEAELNRLYLTSAKIKMYAQDFSAALDDYLKCTSLEYMDKFRVALLYRRLGNSKYALVYCNDIGAVDSKAYAAYVCVADIYAGINRYDIATKVFDVLIDRSPNRARYYADRAVYKKLDNDFIGYEEDMKKARDLDPDVKEESTLIKDTLYPKGVDLLPIK